MMTLNLDCSDLSDSNCVFGNNTPWLMDNSQSAAMFLLYAKNQTVPKKATAAVVMASTSARVFQQYCVGIVSAVIYSALHGYDTVLWLDTTSLYNRTFPGHFSKIRAMSAALESGYDAVLYRDCDQVFHPSFASFPFVKYRPIAPLLLSEDDIACSGSMIVRPSVLPLLREWWNLGQDCQCFSTHSFEQIAFWEIMSRSFQGALKGIPEFSNEKWVEKPRQAMFAYYGPKHKLYSEALIRLNRTHLSPIWWIPSGLSIIRKLPILVEAPALHMAWFTQGKGATCLRRHEKCQRLGLIWHTGHTFWAENLLFLTDLTQNLRKVLRGN